MVYATGIRNVLLPRLWERAMENMKHKAHFYSPLHGFELRWWLISKCDICMLSSKRRGSLSFPWDGPLGISTELSSSGWNFLRNLFLLCKIGRICTPSAMGLRWPQKECSHLFVTCYYCLFSNVGWFVFLHEIQEGWKCIYEQLQW